MAKTNGARFSAFIKYTVEVEVPLAAGSLVDAVAAAEAMQFRKLYETTYEVFDHGPVEVTSVHRS